MKYRGTGVVTDADYKKVKWVGETKSKKAVTIELDEAINMGNIDWTMAEKDDTVAQIVMTAVYNNTNSTSTSTEEPWTVEVDGTESGASEIMLGAGIFYIGDNPIALTRGGGKFNVERSYREINADGDRGPVKGRIVLDGSKATLTMNVLTILTKFVDLYPAVEEVKEAVKTQEATE